ncbi:hypothetical protein R5R40_09300 [Oenococcus oeni]|uniref:hypothetical protein n=1 Tax=Oenococcus oeni TaxID=1247 RepID=UPI000BDF7EA6|nr:hypothetical protein [Oenococcus oeni]PDH84416.1 hypothetical protein AO462_05375 [Oenococcus oeni]
MAAFIIISIFLIWLAFKWFNKALPFILVGLILLFAILFLIKFWWLFAIIALGVWYYFYNKKKKMNKISKSDSDRLVDPDNKILK